MIVTRSSYRVAVAVALGCGFASLAHAEVAGPGPLVTAQWVQDHLAQVQVVALADDAALLANAPKFLTDAKTGAKSLSEAGGRIAGARFVDFNTIREERTVEGVKLKAMMPTKESFEKTMDAAGLEKGKVTVIVAPSDSPSSMDMAARLYFQLKYFGDDNVTVLNGGLNAWLAAGYPVVTEAIAPKQGDWKATTERADLIATTDDVKAALKDRGAELIDARPVAQFFGTAKSPVVAAAGHLEGAKSLPAEAVTRAVGPSQQFLTDKQYAAILGQQQIDPAKPSISYCNTGHFAAGAWFITHEILGRKEARLYAGSMNEWTNLKNPVVGLPQ